MSRMLILGLAAIAFLIALIAFSVHCSSVFPGGFAQSEKRLPSYEPLATPFIYFIANVGHQLRASARWLYGIVSHIWFPQYCLCCQGTDLLRWKYAPTPNPLAIYSYIHWPLSAFGRPQK